MKLAPKFTIVFVAAFVVMLVVAGLLSYSYLQGNARNEVLAQAKLMMEAAAAMRTYTNDQVKPIGSARRATEFHAQWVSAYGATQLFSLLRLKYPAYSYKEATLNPRNLSNRAVDWEADIVNEFRNAPEMQELSGERGTPDGRSLFLAHPISVAPTCLECHSTPQVAPPIMVAQYGAVNGFGWKLHDIVGAQIVSVPADTSRLTASSLRALATAMVCFALLSLIVLNALLAAFVIRPLGRITGVANQIADGNLEAAAILVDSRDEIAELGNAVTRMREQLAHPRNRR
jgi:methyl-accepting chemotaxis protein